MAEPQILESVSRPERDFCLPPEQTTGRVSLTFSTQVAAYLHRLETRNRARAKPATLATYESYARTHVLPMLGDVDLADFTNGPMKRFVQELNEKELSPKSVKEIVSFVRSVIASAVDEEGNKFYPRQWNHDFIDAIPVGAQLQPIACKDKLQAVLDNPAVRVRDRVFLALAAASGLRLGELSAIKIGGDRDSEDSHWDATASMIRVRMSVWRGKLQMPKTAAAIREVDLCQSVNEMLAAFTKSRARGEFIFATKNGRPLDPKYIRDYILEPNAIPGAHALRRFRVSHLREVGCNEDILRGWIGHGKGSEVTDRYSKLSENLELRRTYAERAGTGLDLSFPTKSKTAQTAGGDIDDNRGDSGQGMAEVGAA
jgi:integrase